MKRETPNSPTIIMDEKMVLENMEILPILNEKNVLTKSASQYSLN